MLSVLLKCDWKMEMANREWCLYDVGGSWSARGDPLSSCGLRGWSKWFFTNHPVTVTGHLRGCWARPVPWRTPPAPALLWWHHHEAPNNIRGLLVLKRVVTHKDDTWELLSELSPRQVGDLVRSELCWMQQQQEESILPTHTSLSELWLLWMWIFITCALTATPQRLPIGYACARRVWVCALAFTDFDVLFFFLSGDVVGRNFRKSRKKVGREPMALLLRSNRARRNNIKNFWNKNGSKLIKKAREFKNQHYNSWVID